jgi:hypothetical protein
VASQNASSASGVEEGEGMGSESDGMENLLQQVETGHDVNAKPNTGITNKEQVFRE